MALLIAGRFADLLPEQQEALRFNLSPDIETPDELDSWITTHATDGTSVEEVLADTRALVTSASIQERGVNDSSDWLPGGLAAALISRAVVFLTGPSSANVLDPYAASLRARLPGIPVLSLSYQPGEIAQSAALVADQLRAYDISQVVLLSFGEGAQIATELDSKQVTQAHGLLSPSLDPTKWPNFEKPVCVVAGTKDPRLEDFRGLVGDGLDLLELFNVDANLEGAKTNTRRTIMTGIAEFVATHLDLSRTPKALAPTSDTPAADPASPNDGPANETPVGTAATEGTTSGSADTPENEVDALIRQMMAEQLSLSALRQQIDESGRPDAASIKEELERKAGEIFAEFFLVDSSQLMNALSKLRSPEGRTTAVQQKTGEFQDQLRFRWGANEVPQPAREVVSQLASFVGRQTGDSLDPTTSRIVVRFLELALGEGNLPEDLEPKLLPQRNQLAKDNRPTAKGVDGLRTPRTNVVARRPKADVLADLESIRSWLTV